MTRSIRIGKFNIDDSGPAFVIAEIGHNHAGDMAKAKAMVLSAKESGASAVKFQTRHPKDVYSVSEYNRTSDNPHWMDPVYGVHREKLEFSPEQWQELFGFCRGEEILAFSTPFDFRSVDLLESLDVSAYKVASGDATNIPLIEYIGKAGKPMIISTGGCSIEDVDRIYNALSRSRTPFALMQCSCIYPAPSRVMNLRVVNSYRERYPEIVVGLSSHSPEIHTTIGAFTLGARIFEHHFTNDRAWKGTDNHFSITPTTLKELVHALDEVSQALGDGLKYCFPEEESYTIERRKKLVWARDLPFGRRVESADIAIMCPGNGVQPYDIGTIVGSVLLHKVSQGADVRIVDIGDDSVVETSDQ